MTFGVSAALLVGLRGAAGPNRAAADSFLADLRDGWKAFRVRQRHVPPESLSRVSSYDWFGSLALDPIGLAIWGPIAAVIGINASLWTAFGLMVAGALALLAVPEIRGPPAAPAEGVREITRT